MTAEEAFEIPLDRLWQAVFEVGADLAPICAMAVTHREKMAMPQTHDVGIRDVRVLVDLVGIVC